MEKKKNDFQKGEIVIYKSAKSGVEVEVRFEKENVWLRQDEIARLYNKERSVITKHINNIFKDKEVDKKSNVQKLHIPGSDKPVAFYSLDVILAVGYRTNSAKAIHFRKWATNVLKRYLLRGYALNEKRLLQLQSRFKELQNAINVNQRTVFLSFWRTRSSERGKNFKERPFLQDIPVLPFQIQAGIFYQEGKTVEVSISRNL